MSDPKMNRYIARGVRSDCRLLIERFCERGSLRYGTFVEFWQKMKFSYIYYGRRSIDELLEFTEEAIRIAKELWLDSESLDEQVGGFYVLYGLYMKQLFKDRRVKIRLTLSEMKKALDFQALIRSKGLLDANLILSKLFLEESILYCATKYPHGLEKNTRRYQELDRSAFEKCDLKYKKVSNPGVFEELELSLKKYEATKAKVSAFSGQTFPSATSDITLRIAEKLKNVIPKSQVAKLSADFRRKTKRYHRGVRHGINEIAEAADDPNGGRAVVNEDLLTSDSDDENDIQGSGDKDPCAKDEYPFHRGFWKKEHKSYGTQEDSESEGDDSEYVAVDDSEENYMTVGPRTSGKQHNGQLSNGAEIFTEGVPSGSTHQLNYHEDSGTDDDYDDDDDDEDDEDDDDQIAIMSKVVQEDMQKHLHSMPVLFEESHISQISYESNAQVTEPKALAADEDQADGGGTGVILDSNAMSYVEDELCNHLFGECSGSDDESGNADQK